MKSLKEFFFSKKRRARAEAAIAPAEPKASETEAPNESLSPNLPDYDFFSHPDMKDLAEVGKTKALGYLPFDLIRASGFDSFQVTLLLKQRGLKLLLIPLPEYKDIYAYNTNKKKYIRIADNTEYTVIPKGSFRSIRSGALVAYDEEAVNTFLKENEAIISEDNGTEPNLEYHWPMIAEDFVNMLFRKQAESQKMDNLVSKIFKEMPHQVELSQALKSFRG